MSESGCFLNMAKPSGLSSRDIVNRIERIAGTKRVGHAGTLDPLASGVLVVAVGKATRLIEYAQRLPKCYLAQFRFGLRSDTDDLEGTVATVELDTPPSFEAIASASRRFMGAISQTPPIYSAVKVDGRRAYERARKGQKPDLKPRIVHVHSFDIVDFHYPDVTVRISCGSGTYIRSIARDWGESLGTGGLMTSLIRTSIGPFALESAVSLEQLEEGEWRDHALPMEMALSSLPRLELDEEGERRFRHGLSVSMVTPTPGECVVFDRVGRLLGIAVADGVHRLKPTRGGFVEPGGLAPATSALKRGKNHE